jgi:hypothetical protein
MHYILKNSYSGQREREILKKHLSHYPRRIITGLQAGLILFITLAFITLYLIAFN